MLLSKSLILIKSPLLIPAMEVVTEKTCRVVWPTVADHTWKPQSTVPATVKHSTDGSIYNF